MICFLRTPAPGRALFVVCALALAVISGCRNRHRTLSPGTIHVITQEFATTASQSAPPGAIVKTKRSATETPNTADYVSIHILTARPGASAVAIDTVLRSLAQVTTRHRLTQDSPDFSDGTIRFRIRSGSEITHVLIVEQGSAPEISRSGTHPSSTYKLAIILDDLGGDLAAARAIFALHVPVTISVLPGHPYSSQIAEEARQNGTEVMLHLPMQALGAEPTETSELRPGMDSPGVASAVDQFLAGVPGASGVNNHQGSQATADLALMTELMPVLRARGLFYIDSRTTSATVAFDAAQKAGIPCAFRNVPFLDDLTEPSAIKKQIELAFHGAKRKGEAIAIGHPHPQTLAALREMLPEANAYGIKLVHASDLVH